MWSEKYGKILKIKIEKKCQKIQWKFDKIGEMYRKSFSTEK